MKVDSIVIGGGMANTFLFAKGFGIGKSLCEKDLKNVALDILQKAKNNNCEIILPTDVRVCKELKNGTQVRNISLEEMGDDDIIADVGQQSAAAVASILKNYKTLVWNGPLGAFEIKPFDDATNLIANEVAKLSSNGSLICVAGGGDIVCALNSINLADKFTYISTAGGAFLEWLEGKSLPGIDALSIN